MTAHRLPSRAHEHEHTHAQTHMHTSARAHTQRPCLYCRDLEAFGEDSVDHLHAGTHVRTRSHLHTLTHAHTPRPAERTALVSQLSDLSTGAHWEYQCAKHLAAAGQRHGCTAQETTRNPMAAAGRSAY
jgi:hypothetical protein